MALEFIVDALLFCWHFFSGWLAIFAAPFRHFEILWIIIPIWISWAFTELFQEKHGTNLGNAISNGIIPLWVGMDWTRFLSNQVHDGIISLTPQVYMKFSICAALFLYGLLIIVLGFRGSHAVKEIGRIREVTYVMVMFTPVIYGAIALSWTLLFQVVLFFPLFYLLIEFIDDMTPDPKALTMDEGKS